MGCCPQVKIVEYNQTVAVDNYKYCITIHYCNNCGSLKATSGIKEIKDDN
jgi:hypothetical protein